MKVRCINDDWSNVDKNSVAALVLKVGDPMPIKGEEYEVIGYSHNEDGEKGYELAGLDYSNYPSGKLLFKKERFEISDNTFIPNDIIDGQIVRRINMYCSFSFPIKSLGRLPRKKKKMLKKYGFHYTHPKHKLVRP